MKLFTLIVISTIFSLPLFSQSAEEYLGMALLAHQTGNILNKIEYAEKAIKLFEKKQIFNDKYCQASLIAASGYSALDSLSKAIEILEKAKSRYTRGSTKIKADLYGTLGYYYFIAIDSVHTESLLLEADSIYNELGLKGNEYFLNLKTLGEYYWETGKDAEAEPLLIEATAWLKENMPNNIETLGSWYSLGRVYFSLGKFEKAESTFLDLLKFNSTKFENNQLFNALIFHYLKEIALVKNEPSKAELYYLQTIKIFEETGESKSQNYGMVLHNFGSFYFNEKNYPQAINYLKRALEIRKIYRQEYPLDYVITCDLIATAYAQMKIYNEADKYYSEIQKVFSETRDTLNIDYTIFLHNFGLFYYNQRNLEKAEEYYNRCLSLSEKLVGKNFSDYPTILFNLASVYKMKGEYAKAESLYVEAFELANKIDKNKEINETVLENFGQLYIYTKQYEKAFYWIEKALKDAKRKIIDRFPALSEEEKEIRLINFNYQTLFSVNSSLGNTKSKIVYDYYLFRKGLVLNSSANIREFIANSDNKKLKEKYEGWQSLLAEINQMISKTPEQREMAGFDLKAAQEKAELLEKELSQMSSEFKDFVLIPNYKWEDVQKKMKPGEALVEFVNFYIESKEATDETRYGVYITKSGQNEPIFIELKDGNKLDRLIIPELNERNKNPLAYEAVDDGNSTGNNEEKGAGNDEDNGGVISEKTIYNELFAQIAEHLKGIKKVYISPDGEFYKVNFNTIKNPKTGKYLIEEYEINYITSGNDIVRGTKSTKQNKTAVLMGYPNYNLSSDKFIPLVQNQRDRDSQRDVTFEMSESRQFYFQPLSGTMEETKETGSILRSAGWAVKTLLYDEATETNLKKVKAPGILSVATHGYFQGNPDYSREDEIMGGIDNSVAFYNPLLRSGLLLTGAQTYQNSTPEEREKLPENGIFTGAEAAQLNLFGTDVVILSACETGLGKVNNGEGVFGLQRGFFGAGANSVLMSLWKVNDAATKELMIEFMKNYSTTFDKQGSLRKAQLTLMKKYPKPYYWGAFVLVER
ncbi:MAG: CHAT domain-containing protein [Ignavibacteriales bacterium]|nr:MAG: CHAT domain-containing protein [Ignavibacteriaceae bacterium]MBW7873817.1 CHAT domain-containing protein [Ignavibacteria bacterium]MCZ2144154.1 CHAT domain-containing protein [Ignavibacteriales bacterium]OQY70105.1 MAG: hypothetical protein B6D45_11815 [Ignavibacteriales bacterium UTCHB3]MBV6445793.1 hypothetical protein [Ignavibacteriaceae bacterium]